MPFYKSDRYLYSANFKVDQLKTTAFIAALLVCFALHLSAQSTLSLHGSVNLYVGTNTTVEGSVEAFSGYSGNLSFQEHSDTLSIGGDFINSSTTNSLLSSYHGTIELNGTSPQTISGNSDFYNLAINNGTGVTISTGQPRAFGTVNLIDGTLSTNDSLVLASNDSLTGRIAAITGGSIAGKIFMQRFLGGADTTGWRMLASAVDSQTVNAWADDFLTTGFTGSTYPSYSFVNVYTYNEPTTGSSANGWTSPGNATDTVHRGKGMLAFIGPLPKVIDNWGVPNTGNIALPLDYTNTGSASDDGWNLVGNPWPSNIDWDAGAWTRTNVNNAIYTWDHKNKQYASYVSGVGTNGGTRYIASSQGFFVQATAASPVLSGNESVKTEEIAGLWRPAPTTAILRLKFEDMLGSQYPDETVIRFNDDATAWYDIDVDARKLVSTDSAALTLNSYWDATDFSVNTVPLLDGPDSIPLRHSANEPGVFWISVEEYPVLPPGYCLQLMDRETGIATDVLAYNTYIFDHSDLNLTERFHVEICFEEPISEVPQETSPEVSEEGTTAVEAHQLNRLRLFPNPARESATVQLDAASPGPLQLQLVAIDGTVVWTQQRELEAGRNTINIPLNEVSTGIYLVEVASNSGRTWHKLLITE